MTKNDANAKDTDTKSVSTTISNSIEATRIPFKSHHDTKSILPSRLTLQHHVSCFQGCNLNPQTAAAGLVNSDLGFNEEYSNHKA